MKNIKIDPPFKQIYGRLGFNFYSTNMKNEDKDKIDKIILLASSYCELAALWEIVAIEKKDNNKIFIKDHCIESIKLFNFLQNSNETIILATTVGNKIIEYRENLMNKENIFEAVIVDAVGSEMVEAYTDYINFLIKKELIKINKKITKMRFSPGYGDLDLKYQKVINEILNLNLIDVKVMDNFILSPEKSITAFIGIE